MVMLDAIAWPSSGSLDSAAAVCGKSASASPERPNPGLAVESGISTVPVPAPGTRGVSVSTSVLLLPDVPCDRGLEVGWNRKGISVARVGFSVAIRGAKLAPGALTRITLWAVGAFTLAAVVPDEMKLPNCRPTLALGSMTAGLCASTTGVMALVLSWVMVRPNSPPAATVRLLTLKVGTAWLVPTKSWPLLSLSLIHI